MALLSVLADKGGGVTTSAVALAAVWPRPVLLAECDVAGGDLAYRLLADGGKPLAQDRGVVSLAATVRGLSEPCTLGSFFEHTQRLDGGLPVLVGPTLPEQAAAMADAWSQLAPMLAGLPESDVIADCGRVLGTTPVLPMLRRSALIVMVARASVEGVAHLRHGLAAVARAVDAVSSSASAPALTRMAVLLIAEPSQTATACRQVSRVLSGTPGLAGVPVVGVLAEDPAAARGLGGHWDRRLDRSALIRSAREAAQQLHARLHAGEHQRAQDPAAAPPAGLSASRRTEV